MENQAYQETVEIVEQGGPMVGEKIYEELRGVNHRFKAILLEIQVLSSCIRFFGGIALVIYLIDSFF